MPSLEYSTSNRFPSITLGRRSRSPFLNSYPLISSSKLPERSAKLKSDPSTSLMVTMRDACWRGAAQSFLEGEVVPWVISYGSRDKYLISLFLLETFISSSSLPFLPSTSSFTSLQLSFRMGHNNSKPVCPVPDENGPSELSNSDEVLHNRPFRIRHYTHSWQFDFPHPYDYCCWSSSSGFKHHCCVPCPQTRGPFLESSGTKAVSSFSCLTPKRRDA